MTHPCVKADFIFIIRFTINFGLIFRIKTLRMCNATLYTHVLNPTSTNTAPTKDSSHVKQLSSTTNSQNHFWLTKLIIKPQIRGSTMSSTAQKKKSLKYFQMNCLHLVRIGSSMRVRLKHSIVLLCQGNWNLHYIRLENWQPSICHFCIVSETMGTSRSKKDLECQKAQFAHISIITRHTTTFTFILFMQKAFIKILAKSVEQYYSKTWSKTSKWKETTIKRPRWHVKWKKERNFTFCIKKMERCEYSYIVP